MNGTEIGFDAVRLGDSIVLGWASIEGGIAFDLEISLDSEHPDYEVPREGERSCFKPGQIRFTEVRQSSGLADMSEVTPSGHDTSELDYDTLHGLWALGPDRWYIEGEFGEVVISSAPPSLLIVPSGRVQHLCGLE